MREPFERLRWIRIHRGFSGATDAARRYGWNENTYRSHENGVRAISKKAGDNYARTYKVPYGWLMMGEGSPGVPMTAKLVGYVGDRTGITFHDAAKQSLDEVPLPPGGSETTKAVEVRGNAMAGVALDGWLVFYDDIKRFPDDSLLGKLCVVGLADASVLIKTLQKGRVAQRFDLWSMNEQPLMDQEVIWASPVTWIKPN
jgi:hypothetical protein